MPQRQNPAALYIAMLPILHTYTPSGYVLPTETSSPCPHGYLFVRAARFEGGSSAPADAGLFCCPVLAGTSGVPALGVADAARTNPAAKRWE